MSGSSIANNAQCHNLSVTGNINAGSVVSNVPNMCIISRPSDLASNQTIADADYENSTVTWDLSGVVTSEVNNGGYTVSTTGITPSRSGWYEIGFAAILTSMTNLVEAYANIAVDGTVTVLPGIEGIPNTFLGAGNDRVVFNGKKTVFVNAGELISVGIYQDSDDTGTLTHRRLEVRAL